MVRFSTLSHVLRTLASTSSNKSVDNSALAVFKNLQKSVANLLRSSISNVAQSCADKVTASTSKSILLRLHHATACFRPCCLDIVAKSVLNCLRWQETKRPMQPGIWPLTPFLSFHVRYNSRELQKCMLHFFGRDFTVAANLSEASSGDLPQRTTQRTLALFCLFYQPRAKTPVI